MKEGPFYTIGSLISQCGWPNKPSPTSNRLVCNIKSYNRISHTDWVLKFYGLEVLWKLGGSAWRLLTVASLSRHFNVWYVRNASNRLRFQDRRKRDFYPFRCGTQLGSEEFTLADADGTGLLRHRADGHGCVALR